MIVSKILVTILSEIELKIHQGNFKQVSIYKFTF
jgi:hypothetical protein